MNVRTKLEEEFNNLMNQLNQLDSSGKEYATVRQNAMELSDRLISIQKMNDEYDLRSRQIKSESDKLEFEQIQQKKRNKIEWAKVIIPTVGAATMGIVTMIWEKTDTMTFTPGKNALRDILSFKLK